MVVEESVQDLAGVTPCPGGSLVFPTASVGHHRGRRGGVRAAQAVRGARLPTDVRSRRDQHPDGVVRGTIGSVPACDREAREYVGWPRITGISGTPSRAAVRASNGEARKMEPWMTKHDLRRMRWLREAERELRRTTRAASSRRTPTCRSR